MNLLQSIIFLLYWLVTGYGIKLSFRSPKKVAGYAELIKSHMTRRSVTNGSQSVCKNRLDVEAEKRVRKYHYPLKNDRNMDLQLVYLGKKFETQVLVTTMSYSTFGFLFAHKVSSNLYQTTDGGRTFDKIQDKIGSAAIRADNGIMKSPLDPSWVILISHSTTGGFGLLQSFDLSSQKSVLYISKNAGANFTSVTMPFKLRNREPLYFHPKKKDWIIALEEQRTVIMNGQMTKYGFAWISKDFGATWKEMLKGKVASSVKWGAAEGKEGDEIYLGTHSEKSTSFFSMFTSTSSLTLWRSSDGGHFFEEVVEHCYNFGVEGKFVFATVVFNETESGGRYITKRIMHVSEDSGANFHPVHVPEITQDRFYAILEMHKGMVFLHVDDEKDTGKGTLYISGADGLMYTKSLDNHFYTNAGDTDFTLIESMHGVYITHTLAADNTMRSVITFNRGVTWNSIYVDKEKYCKNKLKDCSLHFHKDFSRRKGIDVQPPLSSASAPGIIFMHGVAGDALTGTTDVWLSVNGGYNWTKVAEDPHHYAIGDNGNLLVILPRRNNSGNILRYSIDQGNCWHDLKFTDDNQPMLIRGLVTEPHAQERSFSLWGYFTNIPNTQREWNVITVNFHEMFEKKCEATDLRSWSPHALNGKNGCFLGWKTFYWKPTLDANCYLGRDFKQPIKRTQCRCDKDDLECDYGYERQADGTCQENKSIKPIEICRKGEEIKERFSKGYRRVPGDDCTSKQAIDDVVKFIDEKKKCVPSEKDAFGIVKEEKKILKFEKEKKEEAVKKKEEAVKKKEKEEKTSNAETDFDDATVSHHKSIHHSKGGFFLFFGILVAVLGVGTIGWHIVKFVRNRRSTKHTFVMSNLVADEAGNDNVAFDARPSNLRDYRDESDVEDDVMLPV